MTITTKRAVATVRPGDLVARIRPEGTYLLKVTSHLRSKPDLFGRGMIVFDVEVVSGPDRVGDSGEVMYGPGATVELVEL